MRLTVPPLLLVVSVWGCDRSPTQPEPPPPPAVATIDGVTPLGQMVLGANVTHDLVDADFLRVTYHSAANVDSGVTPWQAADAGSILVLGLLPATDYSMSIESMRGNVTALGPQAVFTTGSLPSGLAQTHLNLDAAPSGGYSIANIGAPDGNGYVVIFDST